MLNESIIDVQSLIGSRLSLFQNASDDVLASELSLIQEYSGIGGFTVADYCESPFCGFHPEAVRVIARDDDYYLGRRADHFVLIFGWSEALLDQDDQECVLCLTNHKGGVTVRVYKFNDSK